MFGLELSCLYVISVFLLMFRLGSSLNKRRRVRDTRVRSGQDFTRLRVMHKLDPMWFSMTIFCRAALPTLGCVQFLKGRHENANGMAATDSILGLGQVFTVRPMVPLFNLLHAFVVQISNGFKDLESLRRRRLIVFLASRTCKTLRHDS